MLLRRTIRSLSVAAVLLFASACNPSREYVAADKGFFEAITPRYAAYVTADPTLKEEDKERLLRTVAAWKLMIDKWSNP